MKRTYRKKFEHAWQADETAKGFRMMPGIDATAQTEVWVAAENAGHWVCIALDGEVDRAELLEATGCERTDLQLSNCVSCS